MSEFAPDEVFDSREVIDRIDELTDARDSGVDWAPEDQEELDKLEAFASEAEGYGDWEYGETFIRDDYFEDYARELAEDCGMVDPNAGWPNNHIDWEAAADELKADYNSYEFDGETYWARF